MLRIKENKPKEVKVLYAFPTCTHCGCSAVIPEREIRVNTVFECYTSVGWDAFHYSYECPYCYWDSPIFNLSPEIEESIQERYYKENSWFRNMWEDFVHRIRLIFWWI